MSERSFTDTESFRIPITIAEIKQERSEMQKNLSDVDMNEISIEFPSSLRKSAYSLSLNSRYDIDQNEFVKKRFQALNCAASLEHNTFQPQMTKVQSNYISNYRDIIENIILYKCPYSNCNKEVVEVKDWLFHIASDHSSKKNFLKQIFLEISDNVSEIFCSSSFHSSSSQNSSIFHNDHVKDPESHFTEITSKQVNVEQNQSNCPDDPIDDISSNKSRQILSKQKETNAHNTHQEEDEFQNSKDIEARKTLDEQKTRNVNSDHPNISGNYAAIQQAESSITEEKNDTTFAVNDDTRHRKNMGISDPTSSSFFDMSEAVIVDVESNVVENGTLNQFVPHELSDSVFKNDVSFNLSLAEIIKNISHSINESKIYESLLSIQNHKKEENDTCPNNISLIMNRSESKENQMKMINKPVAKLQKHKSKLSASNRHLDTSIREMKNKKSMKKRKAKFTKPSVKKLTNKQLNITLSKEDIIENNSSSCTICGKNFRSSSEKSDIDQRQVIVRHLCLHFRILLQKSLPEKRPPYICIENNCKFQTMKKLKWAEHHGHHHDKLWPLYNRYTSKVKGLSKFKAKVSKNNGQHESIPVARKQTKMNKIASKICYLCKKEFKGENKIGLYKSHMCFHFQKRLLKDLSEPYPPFVCPIKTCSYQSHIKCNWIIHYGIEHKLTSIMQDQYLEQIAADIAESKNKNLFPIVQDLNYEYRSEQATYPFSANNLYENEEDMADFFKYIGLQFDNASASKGIPEKMEAIKEISSCNESNGVMDFSNITLNNSNLDKPEAERIFNVLEGKNTPTLLDKDASDQQQVEKQSYNMIGLVKDIELRKNSKGIAAPSLCIRTSRGEMFRSAKELREYLKDVQKQDQLAKHDSTMDSYSSFRNFIRSLAFKGEHCTSQPSRHIKMIKFTKLTSKEKNKNSEENVNNKAKDSKKIKKCSIPDSPKFAGSKFDKRFNASDKVLELKRKALLNRKEKRIIHCAYHLCEKKFECISLYKVHIAATHVNKQLFHQAQKMIDNKVCTWCEMKLKGRNRIELYRLSIHIGVTHNQILAYVIPEVHRQILSYLRRKKQVKK